MSGLGDLTIVLMKLITWNIQGLGGSKCMLERKNLRQEFKSPSFRGIPDILLLQEHHLSANRISSIGNPLAGDWHTIWSPAQGEHGRKGGVCTSIKNNPDIIVVGQGTIVEGRAIYVTIRWQQRIIGIINVYAPNSTVMRALFWRQLADGLPMADAWILAGDFNMTMHAEDKVGGMHTAVQGSELVAWDLLMGRMGVKDAWYVLKKPRSSLRFSRAGCNINGYCMSRIDRIYISSELEKYGSNVEIIAGSAYSDHMPVSITLVTQRLNKRDCNLRISNKLFEDVEVRSKIRSIWENNLAGCGALDNLQGKMIETSKYLHEETKNRLERSKEREVRLRRSIAAAQRMLQKNPKCLWSRSGLEAAKETLQRLIVSRNKMVFRSSAAWWSRNGDKVNQQFFKFKKPCTIGNFIPKLIKEDGSLSEDVSEIMEAVTSHYNGLLSNNYSLPDQPSLAEFVLEGMQPRISEVAQVKLSGPLLEEEVSEALASICRTSCPGDDGLSKDFYEKFWEIIKVDLVAGLNEAWDDGYLPEHFKEGLIFLIPKVKGIVSDVRQWRPITLLNTIYKIFANMLAKRVKPHLHALINVGQTGFMENRCIIDNVLTFWEAIALAKKTNQHIACLMLDFEKAYDRVQWPFLDKVMERLGLPSKWRAAALALYKGSLSRVLVLGQRGPSIPLCKSVRQGCPLAPYLYLFISEAFSFFLNRPDAGIRGLVVPHACKDLLDSMYADDTMLYLQGNDANLQQAENRIELFCKASGGKINWNKSRGFWVSPNSWPNWQPNADFQWVPNGRAVKYLGFLVGIEIQKNQQLEQVKDKIRKKLRVWASVKLSLACRVIVVNHIFLATMWHLVACWVLAKTCIKNIKAMVRGFLWSSRDHERASTKVEWSCLIKAKNQGGLGLVYLVHQSKALLGKLLVRSLQPRPELWMMLLRDRVVLWCPRNGDPWKAKMWWLFSPDLKMKKPTSTGWPVP